MKIIDLLNKIANGDIPKKIKYKNHIYEYYNGDYREQIDGAYDSNWLFANEIIDLTNLNEEIEILEEPKGIPKRIQSNGENLYSEYIGQWLINKENYTEYDELLMNKINEIIDYLESENK